MKGTVAVNTQHIKKNRGYAETFTREQLDGLLSEPWLKQMVADIRNGDEKKKDYLPYICPHYSAFRNNHRAQADIIPEAFTYMTCVDVDDKELVDKAVKNAMALNQDEYSDWQDQVLRMEYSARKKLHIYIRIPKGMTIEEAQKAFCKEIDVPYDESCITPERFIYVTGTDEEIYRSTHWLEPLSEEELAERKEAYLERGLDVDGRPLEGMKSEELRVKNESDITTTDSQLSTLNSQLEYHDVPYAKIVEAWLGGKKIKQGDRHRTSLILADHLRYITDNDPVLIEQILRQTPFVDAIVKERNENVAATVKSAQAYEFLKGIPKRMKDALKRAGVEDSSEFGIEGLENAAVPPAMPAKLPKLIQLLISKTPDIYKAAVANAVFPPLATHLCEVRFNYTDNMEYEATLMNCLMAGTGSGKSCIDKPIEHIMADIERRDKENERREDEWKKDCQKKGANKDKLLRPEGLVIQIIDPDMTKPALVTRMDESEGHFVYVKLNELDLFEQLKGATGKQHFQLMCLAFDTNATYGQTRIGTSSVTARPKCRFNWNACTTIMKGRRFFRNVLTDGPISRINFCTIPEQEIGAEQPIYGRYDAEFDEALKPYIDKLVAARGLVDCPQAYKLAKKLQQECAEFARLSQSDTYWNLSHRACVIAWLKACVLYVANGGNWEKSIEDFIRWSLNYDLWCKMQFFGADIERANSGEDSRIGTPGPRNLLDLLPDVFSLEDAKHVRQKQGMSNENRMCQKMISQWVFRKYVLQITDYSYQKSEKYKSIHNS